MIIDGSRERQEHGNFWEEHRLNPDETPLLRDMLETWGCYLVDMPAGDGLLLVEHLAKQIRFMEGYTTTDAGHEAVQRLRELTIHEVNCLLNAVFECI